MTDAPVNLPVTIDLHYDLCDWMECFNHLRALVGVSKYPHLRLVLSTDFFTSGYWIENRDEAVKEGEYVYTPEEAFQLETRVATAIADALRAGRRHVGLIL